MKSPRRIHDEMERDLRVWAARPPALSASEARRRVRARLETRGPARRPALWAAVLAAGAGAAALIVRAPDSRYEPPPVADTGAPAPTMIVFELDSGTRLYFTPASRDLSGRS